jgi:hypothetical protein
VSIPSAAMPADADGLLPVDLFLFLTLSPPVFLPPLPLPGLPKEKPAACRDAAASGVSDAGAVAGVAAEVSAAAAAGE